jgi:class 3 adenylate cyclase
VAGKSLRVRIGIATELVVIGEPIGLGASRQQTPNRATRLQSLAGRGQVVITAATRRQIGGLFTCQDLGMVEVKGVPVAESRYEALPGSTIMPLVSREEELALLLRLWQQAASGEGRVELHACESGIGK